MNNNDLVYTRLDKLRASSRGNTWEASVIHHK